LVMPFWDILSKTAFFLSHLTLLFPFPKLVFELSTSDFQISLMFTNISWFWLFSPH
jgi:hypothetical protein